jgi:hypothetical protein
MVTFKYTWKPYGVRIVHPEDSPKLPPPEVTKMSALMPWVAPTLN